MACMLADSRTEPFPGVLQSKSLPPRTAPGATGWSDQLPGGVCTRENQHAFHGTLTGARNLMLRAVSVVPGRTSTRGRGARSLLAAVARCKRIRTCRADAPTSVGAGIALAFDY